MTQAQKKAYKVSTTKSHHRIEVPDYVTPKVTEQGALLFANGSELFAAFPPNGWATVVQEGAVKEQ